MVILTQVTVLVIYLGVSTRVKHCEQVPVGVAVEQPGGDYSYGAPASPQRGASYVPPRHPAAVAQSSSPSAPRAYDSSSQV